MHFSAILLAAMTASLAAANPLSPRAAVCSGTESSPLCCDVNVGGVAALNCDPRKLHIHYPWDMKPVC